MLTKQSLRDYYVFTEGHIHNIYLFDLWVYYPKGTHERKNMMNAEEKARITTEKVKKLNPTNLMLIDSGVSLLLARQEMERAETVKEIMTDNADEMAKIVRRPQILNPAT